MARGVASGMEYLARINFVHRVIKLKNIVFFPHSKNLFLITLPGNVFLKR